MNDLVTLVEGKPTTTSLIVAKRFGKLHKNVLTAIQNLDCSEEFGRLNFQPYSYVADNGKKNPAYEITRDGFMILAMGFTGKEAMAWKEQFIVAFNAMAKALQEKMRPVTPRLPTTYIAAMEQLIAVAKENLVLADKNARLASKFELEETKTQVLVEKVAAIQPKADALDLISVAEGDMTITRAAKALGLNPKALFAYLREAKWLYRRSGSGMWLSFQSRIDAGYLNHKIFVGLKEGVMTQFEQVRVTPKGLARLAVCITSAVKV